MWRATTWAASWPRDAGYLVLRLQQPQQPSVEDHLTSGHHKSIHSRLIDDCKLPIQALQSSTWPILLWASISPGTANFRQHRVSNSLKQKVNDVRQGIGQEDESTLVASSKHQAPQLSNLGLSKNHEAVQLRTTWAFLDTSSTTLSYLHVLDGLAVVVHLCHVSNAHPNLAHQARCRMPCGEQRPFSFSLLLELHSALTSEMGKGSAPIGAAARAWQGTPQKTTRICT